MAHEAKDHKDTPEHKAADAELVARAADKGKEVQAIFQQLSQRVEEYQTDKSQCDRGAGALDTVPASSDTVIVILGNILNPDGSPQELTTQRLEAAFGLVKGKGLDLAKTTFLVSGGDASNGKYTYDLEKWKDVYKNAPHPSEAKVMRDILHGQYKVPLANITLEEKARTTLENFYYVFKMLYHSKVRSLENFFVVSSDWHWERAKINFDILYEREDEMEEGYSFDEETGVVTRQFRRRQWFACKKLEWVGAKSDEKLKKARDLKELKLRKAKWVKPQAQEYSDYVWQWRDFNDAKNKPTLKRSGTLGAFAYATAIEHMYLRLDNAEHGLTKVVR